MFIVLKGDDADINNYRHLAVMKAHYKIFAKIILKRLNDALDGIIKKKRAIKG